MLVHSEREVGYRPLPGSLEASHSGHRAETLAIACLTVASLREDFQHFYAPDEGAVADALRTGLVALDTNVLLSLYRFQSNARDDLFRALESLENRLWIPYQVALEFHRNRLGVRVGDSPHDGQAQSVAVIRIRPGTALRAVKGLEERAEAASGKDRTGVGDGQRHVRHRHLL